MLASGDLFAGYTIDRELGRGGMGSVYLAKHPRLPRMTALKLLNREMFFDSEVRARFEREADLVARLDHPGIVTVYDRGLDDEQLWISMQYIDGMDAASVDPKTLRPERAVRIITETAEALDYAHGMGILHRDVKPANILIARPGHGRGERVYLTDFGIARLRDDTGHLTQTGTFTATLAYASPEQLTGTTLDHRSDQYSLACTLFWLFTGHGPFNATNPAAVIQGHLQTPPPALTGARPGLPAALDPVLAKAMAKRPEDRFASCAEFAAAARHAINNPHAPMLANPAPGAWAPTPSMPPPSTPNLGLASGTHPQRYPSGAQAGVVPTYAGAGYPSTPTAGAPASNPYTGQLTGAGPSRKTGLIVGLSIALVVLLAAAGSVVLVLRGADSDGSTTAGSTTSAANGPDTSSAGKAAEALGAAFPAMVPSSQYGTEGYNGATCRGDEQTWTPKEGEPDFGTPVWHWRCYGGDGYTDPYYHFFAYSSSGDVQEIVSQLRGKALGMTGTHSGHSYTNYRFEGEDPKMVTAFTGESDKAKFLLYIDGVDGSIDTISSWWKAAPLTTG